MSRESEMVVVQRDAQGKPTVWCDPEIVDLIQALNTNGLRTVASCSGHGHISGFISLADGREILLPRSVEERDLMLSVFTIDINGTPLNEQLPAAAPVAPVAPQDDARDEIRREAFEQAAREPRAYAEMLEKGGWGNRFPDELCAIFNASTNMAERIRALADAPAAKPTGPTLPTQGDAK